MDLAVHIAQIVTALGVVAAAVGLRQSQRQRVRALEDFYIRRYWKIMDELSVNGLRGEKQRRLQEEDERAAWAYLMLCEDQLDQRAEGWISDVTWADWQSAMLAQIDSWPFSEVWTRVLCAQVKPGTKPKFSRLRVLWVERKDPYRPTFRQFAQPRYRGLCSWFSRRRPQAVTSS